MEITSPSSQRRHSEVYMLATIFTVVLQTGEVINGMAPNAPQSRKTKNSTGDEEV